MIKGFKFSNIFIDSANPEALCEFYHKISGWEILNKYGSPALETPNGLTLFFIKPDVPFIRPEWPDQPEKQQKQIHLDFEVGDLDEAIGMAISAGATLADQQYGGSQWKTLLDPDGHPFDLYEED